MKTMNPSVSESFSSFFSVELLDVVSILKSKLDIQALYCFGLRQIKSLQKSFIAPVHDQHQQCLHLDLMVLSTAVPSNAIADLTDLIYKHTGGRYRVTLLLHSPAQVKATSYKNGALFQNIQKSGWLLQAQPELFENPVFPTGHKISVQHIKKFTTNRLYNAQTLFELEDAVKGVEGGLLRASLLHTGMEQLCLAIIYAYMGYYPNHFHLNYLFSLCSHYTPLLEGVFPCNTAEDKKLWLILNTTPQALRFKKSEQFTQTSLQVLVDRCLTLYPQVEKLIEKRIAFLEKHGSY